MATTVGQHSVAAFTSPVNGTTPIDANTVRGNDNTVRVAYVDHDADPGIHVQSSTLASRPVAGTAGRKWITEDSGLYTLWFDDGTNWHPVSSEAVALSVLATETLAKGDVVKVTGWNNGQDLPEVAKTTSASDTAFAVITAAVASGAMGYATNTGVLQDINTNAYNVGDILYANGSGGFTATKPTSGNYQPCAYVMRKNTNNGVIYVEFSTPRIVERSDNTASTIVLRDASGNFSAGTITATAVNTTTIDLTNLEVTNIKAKDGTASATIADSTGVMTIGSSVLTTTDINGGTIDGVTIGGASAGVGTFTTLNATTVNTTTLDLTNLEVTNIKAKDGTAAATIADSTGKITVSTELAVDNLNLSGNAITSTDTNGNIDLTPNGTGEVNITKVDIDSGAIDGTTIGGSSAAAGTFTTVAGTTGNITTVNATTVDTTNIEVTNVKAKDGTASIAIADSTGVATISAAPVLSALTASQAVFTDASKGLVSNAITGTGNVVMSASPTLSGTITAANVSMSGTLTLGSDVALSRGAADRLDLATGDSLNVVSGTYKIAGTDVLSSNTLGSGVTASSLTSVGTLTSLTVSGTTTVSGGGASATPYTTLNGLRLSGGDANNTIWGDTRQISITNSNSFIYLAPTSNGGTQGLAVNTTNGNVTAYNALTVSGATNLATTSAATKIGLGTTSPDASFKVTISGNSGTTTPGIFFDDQAASPKNYVLYTNGSKNFVLRNHTDAINIFEATSAGNVAFDTNTLYVDAANNRVGVGTASPQVAFTVSNNGSAAHAVRLYDTGANASYLALTASNTDTALIASGTSAVPMDFYTGGSVRMRLDASGNLGVGTTSPATRLDVAQTNAKSATGVWQIQTFDTTSATTGVGGGISFGGYKTSTSAAEVFAAIDGYKENSTAGNAAGVLRFHTQVSGGTGVVERARITSGGVWMVGTTGLPDSNGTAVSLSGSSNVARIYGTTEGSGPLVVEKSSNTNTTSQVFVQFTINAQTTGSGQINANGASQAAFGSFSDARLKENIVDLPSQWDAIKTIRPVEFDYIESEGGGHQIGFIAQEIETVYPDLVSERQDGMLTLTGLGKNEARLIKALQEAMARIEALEARLEALEA